MGMAEIAEVLWRRHMRTTQPIRGGPTATVSCCQRPRLDADLRLLHLTGYDLSIDDLKQFRQLSRAPPGHPGSAHTPGVETDNRPARPGHHQRGRHGAG